MRFKTAKTLLLIFLIFATSLSLLQADEQSLSIYAEQLRQMIYEQNDIIKIYKERLSGEDISNSDLLALAEQMVDSLEHWIEADSPFLISERQARIVQLRDVLSSSEVDAVEKIQRIFEAYRIEAEYGFTFENYRARFGKDNAKVVDFLHVGRNILIYRTLDGRQRGVWNRHAKSWNSLKLSYDYTIKRAISIARELTPPQILRLPVQLMHKGVTEDLVSATASDDALLFSEQASEANTISILLPQAPKNLEQEVASLERLLEDSKQQAAELQSSYYQRLGHNKELITVIHNIAEELRTMISESFMPLLLPHYHATLTALLQNPQTLDVAHIKVLQSLFVELYRAQAETGFFNTELILEDGTPAKRKIVHIGPFTLLYNGKFLHYEPSLQRAVVLSKSPNKILSLISDDITEDLNDAFVKVPVDLSRGAVLAISAASLTVIERIQQGGWISYFILVLGAYAFLLVLTKIFMLRACLKSVRAQKYETDYDSNNPLGRVLDAGNRTIAGIEGLEWAIEQAVQREIPLLEWGFGIIKVAIVATPLLGLLGTVFGMIETFQAITLFGTNDPKIIAQGIGMALTTTMLGLSVAIPLLLLYTWAMSYNKEIHNILEEQSAGLLVKQLYKAR